MTTAAEYLEQAEKLYQLGLDHLDGALRTEGGLKAVEGFIRTAEMRFTQSRTAAAIAAAQAAMVAAGMVTSPVVTRVEFSNAP